MRAWLYRWDNGDSSIVWAKNRHDAVYLLDEVGEANPACLIPLPPGAVHFSLSDAGVLERESLSGHLEGFIEEAAYPLLTQATRASDDVGDLEMAAIVEAERTRLTQPREEAKTPAGKVLQASMGLAGSLADEWALDGMKTDGKPQ